MLRAGKDHFLIQRNLVSDSKAAHSVEGRPTLIQLFFHMHLPLTLACWTDWLLLRIWLCLVDAPLASLLVQLDFEAHFDKSVYRDAASLLNVEEAVETQARLLRVHLVVRLLLDNGQVFERHE